MTGIRDYLTSIVEACEGIGHAALLERFILRNGQPFEFEPALTPKKLGTPKECFANAARLGKPYVEGFVMRPGLPIAIHHAWNYDRDTGCAIDATLRPPLNGKDDVREYLGVIIPDADILEAQQRTGYFGVLTDPVGMFNTKLMFKRDPELKAIFEEIVGRNTKARHPIGSQLGDPGYGGEGSPGP